MKSLIRILIFVSAVSGYGQDVRVMTYNIRYDNPGDGINQWSNRKQKVYSLLKKYDPDLLGIQEALYSQMMDIKNNIPGFEFIGVGRDDGKQKGEYSAIFYRRDRFEIIEQNTFWLSETPGIPGSKSWDAAITRVATWARMKDTRTQLEFLIINTHFDHIGKEARAKSAALLKIKALELGKDLPVIITGDFNTTRDDTPYKEMMNKSGLPVQDPAPANPPGTFCDFAVNSMVCRPIDYIFHTREWSADNYTVITDNDGKNYPSDHLPVMVELKIK